MTARSDSTPGRPQGIALAVTSGKGGVGKTSVAVNLAVALARLRHRVAVFDADFGLGNVDVLLGLSPAKHLGHVLSGECQIRDIALPGPLGVQIFPATSGLRELTALTARQWQRLATALENVRSEVDFLLIDTAAGISSNVIDLLTRLDHVLLVTSSEPTAIVDAYALMKILTLTGSDTDIGIVVNEAHDANEGQLVFRQLDVAANRFLTKRPDYYGYVAYDPAVKDACLVQRTIVDHYPQSAASRCFRVLAARIATLSPGGGSGLRLIPPIGPASTRRGVEEVQQCA